jgi:hypothetical protein
MYILRDGHAGVYFFLYNYIFLYFVTAYIFCGGGIITSGDAAPAKPLMSFPKHASQQVRDMYV